MARAKKSKETQERLTNRQYEVLEKIFNNSEEVKVHTIEKDQKEISEEFGITRQALSNHLRKLKDNGYIRTGRGFIDITEQGLGILGTTGGEALILVKATPTKRNKVYEEVSKMHATSLRTTGNMDLIIEVDRNNLEEILNKLSTIEGVEETKTHIILKKI